MRRRRIFFVVLTLDLADQGALSESDDFAAGWSTTPTGTHAPAAEMVLFSFGRVGVARLHHLPAEPVAGQLLSSWLRTAICGAIAVLDETILGDVAGLLRMLKFTLDCIRERHQRTRRSLCPLRSQLHPFTP